MMRTLSIFLSAALLSSGPALAADALESLPISKAKGSLIEEAARAGDYVMATRTSAKGFGGRLTITSAVKFSAAPGQAGAALERRAKCKTGVEISQPLWSGAFGVQMETRRFSGAYSCTFEAPENAGDALELILPPDKSSSVTPGGIMTVEVQRNRPEDYANAFQARLVYRGVTYSAQPRDLDPKKYDGRMMSGFAILRDGQEVGGVDFVGDSRDKGAVRAPAAGSSDREAVIFLALALLQMPDGSSRMVQALKNSIP